MNEEANTLLKSIIKNKSLANGYIFYGAEGLGKKQTALQFIKEIFKQSSPSENVEEKITNNNHPDFLIIEPDSLLATKSSGSFDLEKTIKSESEIIKIASGLIPKNVMVNNIDVEFFVGYGLVKNPTEIYYHQTPLVLSVSDKKN